MALADGDVGVWAFTLDATAGVVEACAQCLSPDERTRASRFTQAVHAARYTVAHATMRTVLARQLGCATAELRLPAGVDGKPGIEGHAVGFNLTHSADRALLAVARGRDVGIDLEREDATLDALAVADRYFHGVERDAIRGASAAQRVRVFLRHWVAKEAVVKGIGAGLRLPLASFAVAPSPDEESAAVVSHDPARVAADWRVVYLACGAGWHAAVAARGNDWRVRPFTATPVRTPATGPSTTRDCSTR